MVDEEKNTNIFVKIITVLFNILFPLILTLIWYKLFNGKIKSILFGIGGFLSSIVLVYILLLVIFVINENLIRKSISNYYNKLLEKLLLNIIMDIVRYVVFYKFLFKEKIKNTSISYGLGHGGAYSFSLGIVLLFQFIFNETYSLFFCIIYSYENLNDFIYNISASIVVYKSVKEKKIYLFIFLIIYDIIAILPIFLTAIEAIKESILVYELILSLFTIIISIFAYLLYKKMEDEEPGEIQPILGNDNSTQIMNGEGK